jgi:hypothetical protein
MAGDVVNIKVYSPLKLHSGLLAALCDALRHPIMAATPHTSNIRLHLKKGHRNGKINRF